MKFLILTCIVVQLDVDGFGGKFMSMSQFFTITRVDISNLMISFLGEC